MKFYSNNKRVHVGSLQTLSTKIRHGKPIMNEDNVNVSKTLKNIEVHFHNGTVVKYNIVTSSFTGVGRGKKTIW